VTGSKQSRRTVTVLFTDMVNSTGLAERLDPEAMRLIQDRYFRASREVIERHGGVLEKFIGDALVAVFGVPIAREDDALRAVRAASELAPSIRSLSRDVHRRLGLGIELRTGIHTGQVITNARDGEADALVTGDAMNVAARLQQLAQPNEILLGPVTFSLVRNVVEVEPLEPLNLRGRAEPILAFRLVSLTAAERRPERTATPLVGRAVETRVLEATLSRVVDNQQAELLTVFGGAGVGKSRLLREFGGRISDRADVLRGRCLPYGDGATYWPVVEILRAAIGSREGDSIDERQARVSDFARGDPDAGRLGRVLLALLGASDSNLDPGDIGWALRRVFDRLARRRPIVAIVEDIHWAEPALLELLQAVVEWTSGVPLLVVCLSRPDLLESWPEWGRSPRSTYVFLEALSGQTAGTLLDSLPGGESLPARVRARILEVADGNPLYLEEIQAKLIEDGSVLDSGGVWSWRGDADQVEIPATIHALVDARMDQLPPDEQSIAERAAVIGRVFEQGGVVGLCLELGNEGVSRGMLELARRQLILPEARGLDGSPTFRFRHIIVRDAAYARLPKAERAELHLRVADWLDRVLADRAQEYVESIAHHLAQAVTYRLELGTIDDDDGARLAERAIGRLADAAERADRLHAYQESARLYGSAAFIRRATREPSGPRPDLGTPELERLAAEAEAKAGDHEQAIERVRRLIEESSDEDPQARVALLERLADYLWIYGDEAGTSLAIDEALTLMPGDSPARERARILGSQARFMMLAGRFDEAAAVSRAALEASSGPGSSVERVRALITLGTALGHLGQLDDAVRFLERGRDLANEVEDGEGVVRGAVNVAIVHAFAGDRPQRDMVYRTTIGRLPALGLTRGAGSHLILNYAGVLTNEGRLDEADEAIDQVLALEPSGDDRTRALVARAAVLAFRGKTADARVALAQARSRQERVRWLTLADVFLVGAWVAILEGRLDDAAREAQAAHAGADGGDVALYAEWIDLHVAVERAVAARASGLDRVDDAVALTTASIDRLRRLRLSVPGIRPFFAHQCLPLLDLELSRAKGQPEPAGWQIAAGALHDLGLAWDEAYARYRGAEALVQVGARPAEIAAAANEAIRAANAIGAEGLSTLARQLANVGAPGGTRTHDL
jgi:class 3 adenylate cyclase/tetratricopeptide (TPR) repeat protein